MRAKDIMTRDVITVAPDMSVEEVARILLEKRISGVPVVSLDQSLVGILSEGDLIRKAAQVNSPSVFSVLGGFVYLENPQRFEEDLRKVTAVRVRDLMTKEVISVPESLPVSEIASLMMQKKINRVPVLRNGKLEGIITRSDIVRSLIE